MVLVRGGSFALGERPGETLSIEDLCVDRTEVTAADYAGCVKAGLCGDEYLDCFDRCVDCKRFATYHAPTLAQHPINCVDFEQADVYCRARDKRLPTSEEWEWLARGAGAARRFPWGDAEPDAQVCWSGPQPLSSTCPVGASSLDASPDGVVDLAGNVAEWTSTGTFNGGARVYRGASWESDVTEALEADDLHSMIQLDRRLVATSRSIGLGMRCVAAPR